MMRKWLARTIVTVLVVGVVGTLPARTVWADATLTVNGNSTSGRAFQGIGMDANGAADRLLKDYPAAQQTQILDYLFRCDTTFCGAALQRLKVEIGGDENSTFGAEPSIWRSGESAPGTASDSAQCRRGVEFLLMKAAISRNSNIKLDTEEWGVPGWIGTINGPGSPDFWSQDNANYVKAFLDCAAEPQNQVNGSALPISTAAASWNETDWCTALGVGADGVNYIKSDLYPTLHTPYPNTKIVAADNPGSANCDPYGWAMASNINSDSTLAADVAYLGAHYQNGCGSDTACQSSVSTAQGLLATHGQYLWSSENTDDLQGNDANQPGTYGETPRGLAEILNRDYLVSKQTATLLCCGLYAYFPSIYHEVALVKANTPWGNASYTVLPQLWVVAHTTQFTRVGWQYLDSGQACLGATDCTVGGSATGSVVTLKATGSSPDFTSIVETTGATTTQNLTYNLSNVKSLACGCVHVWKSDLTAGTYLIQQPDIAVSSGTFTLGASQNSVYTITTTSWGLKGNYTQNPETAFPFPWSDSYQSAGNQVTVTSPDPVTSVTSLDPVVSISTLGSTQNNLDGRVGMVYLNGSNGTLRITQLGRYFVTGNSQIHALSVYLDSNHSLLGSCQVNSATATVISSFQYCTLTTPVAIAANTKYDLVSSETNLGDSWYGYSGTTVSASYGTVPQAISQSSGGTWSYSGSTGNSYGPINFTSVRDDFTGSVGMVYQNGSNAISINQLGIYAINGNNQTHTLYVYLDSNHSLLGQCNVNTATATVINGFQYCALSSPAALATNTSYDIVASETNLGDSWYFYPSTTVSASYGTVPQGVYQDSGGTWGYSGSTGSTYGPVNFTTVRDDFDGNVGMVYQTGAGPITLTQLGLYAINGNTQSHTMAVYLDSNHSLITPTCSVNTSSAAVYNGFQYCALSSPITLTANTKYDIVASESNLGDNWYFYPNTVVSAAFGSVVQGVYQFSGGSWGYSGGSGSAYGPVDFTAVGGTPNYLNDQHGAFEIQPCDGGHTGNCLQQVVATPPICWFCGSLGLVASVTNGTVRNNLAANVGMVYQTPAGGATVSQLGRVFISGNTQTHAVSIYQDSNHSLLGSCNVNTSTGTADSLGFKYCALSSLVALAANTKYDIVSQEYNNGDQWYNFDTSVSVNRGDFRTWGSVAQAVYNSGSTWTYSGSAGASYGPVNLVASSVAGESTPVTLLGRRGPTLPPYGTVASGGSLAVGNYTIKYTYVTANGETEPSPTNDPTNDPIVLTSGNQQISVHAVTPLPGYATAVKWYIDSGPRTGFTVQNSGSAFTLNTAGNGTAAPIGNYTIESSVYWKQAGTAKLLARIQDGAFGNFNYYQFTMTDQGAWSLDIVQNSQVVSTIDSGTTTAPGTGTWNTMEMNLSGNTIKLYWEDTGTPFKTETDSNSTYMTGGVGFGTGWNQVEFSASCWNTSIGPC